MGTQPTLRKSIWHRNCECGTPSPLLCAVRDPNVTLERIEALIRNGADVNVKDPFGGCCAPLVYAARNPNMNYKVIELLLKSGADVDAHNCDDGKSTPLLYAVRNPSVSYEVIELLLSYDSYIHAMNREDGDCTPFIYAVRNPNVTCDIIELLVRWGADVHDPNKDDGDCTALGYAARNPNMNYKLIEILLKNNAIATQDKHINSSALICAVRKRDVDPAIVELFLRYSVRTLNSTRAAHVHMLKYVVLDIVKKNPKCINDSYDCKSVLGDKYFDVFSCYLSTNGLDFTKYVKKCILEIRQMKVDGISHLFFPSASNTELSLVEPRALVQLLLRIWSGNSDRYPMYSKVMQTDLESKDLLKLLPNFQIYRNSDCDGTQSTTFLNYDITLLIVDRITPNDFLHLLEAFYCPPGNGLALEQQGRPHKKQKLLVITLP